LAVGAPHHAINRNISDSLHFIVQIGRRPGTRFVSEAFEIRAYDAQNDGYQLDEVYIRDRKKPGIESSGGENVLWY